MLATARRGDRRGKRRLTSAERRATIVTAAVRLFSERGFRGTTTRELAAAVGVSEPVLYEHFRSKRELYRAIIETKSREGLERAASELAPYMERNDDRGFFRHLARLILDRYAEEPAYMRLLLFLALEGDELAELLYDRHVRQAYKLIAGYIRKRMRQGAFRPMDPVLAARVFLAMPAHHSMMRMLFRDPLVRSSRTRIVESMVNTFLEGIRR